MRKYFVRTLSQILVLVDYHLTKFQTKHQNSFPTPTRFKKFLIYMSNLALLARIKFLLDNKQILPQQRTPKPQNPKTPKPQSFTFWLNKYFMNITWSWLLRLRFMMQIGTWSAHIVWSCSRILWLLLLLWFCLLYVSRFELWYYIFLHFRYSLFALLSFCHLLLTYFEPHNLLSLCLLAGCLGRWACQLLLTIFLLYALGV